MRPEPTFVDVLAGLPQSGLHSVALQLGAECARDIGGVGPLESKLTSEATADMNSEKENLFNRTKPSLILK